MSAGKRIFSGITAGTVQFVVNFANQLLLVPVYLSYWDLAVYGAWLIVIVLPAMFVIPISAYQDYVGNEMLVIGDTDKAQLSKLFFSALPIALILGLLQFLFVFCLIQTGLLGNFFSSFEGQVQANFFSVQYVVMVLVGLFSFLGAIGGLCVRVLSPLGYFSRMAWWGAAQAILTTILPVTAVFMGGGILEAGIAMAIGVLVGSICLIGDAGRLIRRCGIPISAIDWLLGVHAFRASLILAATKLCLLLRQSGFRVVLGAVTGVAEVARFSTTRTLANLIQQGVNILVGPVQPEMMRALTREDQERSDATYGFIWTVLVFVILPVSVVMLLFVEPLFELWTRDQIPFSPELFVVLTATVLVTTVAQPANLIIVSYNQVWTQLILGVVSTIIVLAGVVLFVPTSGLVGAAYAILIAEVISMFCLVALAHRKLNELNLHWPWKTFTLVSLAVFGGIVVMWAMAADQDHHFELSVGFIIGFILVGALFVRSLPSLSWRAIGITNENH